MKIQYISHHSVLEYDEVRLFAELGYSIHSNGVYRDPRGAYTLPRPGIPEIPFDQSFFDLTANHPKTNLPQELIEPYDIIIIMSGLSETALVNNWPKIKHKRVIWRTIGQSTRATELKIAPLRAQGLEIVRYSPKERNIPNYAGEDAIIRFTKDPEELKGWTGEIAAPVNISQSLRGRRDFCHYDEIMGGMLGFPGSLVYGTGNDDLGSMNGGEITYERLKEVLRQHRVYVYGGTWPASYTLSFMEALMTGIPVVAISKKMAHLDKHESLDFYEVDELIEHGVSGFVANDIGEMRNYVTQLINDPDLAARISAGGRKRAIELFGKETIKAQWKKYLLEGGKK